VRSSIVDFVKRPILAGRAVWVQTVLGILRCAYDRSPVFHHGGTFVWNPDAV